MRDMIILFLIIVFWISFATIFSFIYQDASLFENSINTSYDTSMEGISANISDMPEEIPIFVEKIPSKITGFWPFIGRLFTFRLPSFSGIPFTVGLLLSSLNTILIIFSILIGFRLMRHGGG